MLTRARRRATDETLAERSKPKFVCDRGDQIGTAGVDAKGTEEEWKVKRKDKARWN